MQPFPQAHCSETSFTEGEIKGVIIRPLRHFHDERGWLVELFRHDQLAKQFYPVMSYVSVTRPGVQRGPHEHAGQADLFFFIGPGDFLLRLWDNRPASPTYRYMTTLVAGQTEPSAVLIPAGIVHAYRNLSDLDGLVINSPNRLYRGPGYSQPVDEIRHEDDPQTIFRMD